MCLVMMTIAFFLFTLLGLYLDNVIPSAYGRSKPFYFFLSPYYWGCKRNQQAKIENNEDVQE